MEIKVPDLGVDSAEVSEIMIKVGDTIALDDNIVLLESDKASVEVPASVAGTVTAILVNLGDKVKEGDVLIEVATQASDNQPSANNANATVTPSSAPAVASTPVVAVDAPKAEPIKAEPVATTPTESSHALPDLGVDTAQVSEWLVKVGDSVTADQPLVLVESDKASVEVPAPIAGTIVRLLVQTGDTVKNGQDFVIIASGSASVNTDANANANVATQTASPVVNPPASQTATPVATTAPSAPVATNSQADTMLNEAQINATHANVYAGPAVRKLTRQLGVDIGQVKGSGDKGRVVKDDVFAYVKQRMQTLNTTSPTVATMTGTGRASLPNLPDMSKTELWGEIEREPLSRLQKVSIPQLTYNTYLPQVTQFDLSDITDTEAMRSDLKEEMKKQGVSLTILAFIMKATAYALMQFPKFNSHLSDDNTEILIRKTVNMGFAVATDDGLTVPVIQNVQDKGIKQLAIEIGELAKKARDKKLSAKELTGASFTISSQGNLGGTYFTPLVNWPQVAILGVSESSIQPRWSEASQTFEPRLMLPLSLSYDHRVINGADAAVFTRYVAKLLADPRRILL
ncbi:MULTISPECIES: 2-oxo acid dehydrogenase subunit E2 [unclassified Moraxella]|uniref:2-oxo acid dehydrogenase subunit E2 n=1 Tax=unclassified Moraxella TaxID=2685852 RepID=UPI003AF8EEDB